MQPQAPTKAPGVETTPGTTTFSRRRQIFFVLTVVSCLALITLMGRALSAQGITPFEWLLLACFAVTTPLTVVGFWNAMIGLGVMSFARNPSRYVTPPIAAQRPDDPIETRTALLVCIRNEEISDVIRRVETTMRDLVDGPAAGKIGVFLLSDSNQPDKIATEEAEAAVFTQRWEGRIPVTYRRRESNEGYKAGNLRDFCLRWGHAYDFGMVLDADSYMSARKVERMIRIMQANPRMGILQCLMAGLPSDSPFARVFQFGLRLGMRAFTFGNAWWQGDCAPYWGHNALIRLQPFTAFCELPVLPGRPPLGGYVLSHDQAEAALMRRAGYECWVLPEEEGSFEENPPSLLEFIRRDLRWMNGNMQYLWLLRTPGLKPVSRIQYILAIAMYSSGPAWMAFVALCTAAPFVAAGSLAFDPMAGLAAFIIVLTLLFTPKFLTLGYLLWSKQRSAAFGGRLRIVVSILAEIVFTTLLAPTVAVAQTIMMGRLILGYGIGWGTQDRQTSQLPLGQCIARLWPQTLIGILILGAVLIAAPGAIWFALPLLIGLVGAAPFAWITSNPTLGRGLESLGLGRIPEEAQPPVDMLGLKLPALENSLRRPSVVRGLAARAPRTGVEGTAWTATPGNE